MSLSSANSWESADHPRCSAVEEQLQCPVCFNFMYPPIHQCPKGHTLCSNCKPKVNNCCPICRGTIGEIRSLVLEKVSASLSFPCSYHKAGCLQWLRYGVKRKHEETCIYRPFKCPFPGCPLLLGNAEALATHLRTAHAATWKDDCKIDTLFPHLDPKDNQFFFLNVYRCFFEQYFCVQCELVGPAKENIVISLMFIGEETDAKNYSCCLEVGNDRRKMIWCGSPRSIREGCNQQIEDGLALPRTMVNLFAEDSEGGDILGLRIKGSIYDNLEAPQRPQVGIFLRLIRFGEIFWLFVLHVCGVLIGEGAGLTKGGSKLKVELAGQ